MKKCPECGKTFKARGLEIHRRTHAKTAPKRRRKPKEITLELMATTRSGKMLLEDGEGSIWVAQKLTTT